MRTLNVRLAAILLTIGIVLSSSFYLVHKYQIRRNAYAFMRQADHWEELAEQATKKNDLKQALRCYMQAGKCLKGYVYLVPNDVDALEKYGMLLADIAQDYRGHLDAYVVLERTLREDPERTRARRRLVGVAVTVGRYQDARQHLKESLLRDYPKDPLLWDLLGQCYMGTNEFQSARDCFKKAIEISPRQVATYSRLARVLYLHLSGGTEAGQWMDKLVQRNPKEALAHFERAFYLSDLDTHGEAIKETLKSLELKPDNHDALLLTVRCYLALRDVEKSHQYAARSIKLFPEDYNVYRNMANIEMASGHVDKAVAVVQQGLKVLRQDPTLLWTLTNLLIDANRLKEAKETIAKLQAINYPRRFIALLNARTEMIQGHWLAACQGFEKVRGYLMAPGARDLLKYADLWIADCYSQLGNRDQQIATLRRSVKADPFFGLARANLADALLSAGNVDQAVNESRDLIDLSHIGTPGLIAMVRILILKNLRQAGAERDWRPVEKMIDDAEKAMPDSVQILILRGELLVAQNRIADAEALLQKAKSKTPGRPNSGQR